MTTIQKISLIGLFVGRVSVHVSGPADARQAASEAAPLPATRLFSRKSVGGNALRILANATEVSI